MLLPHVYEKFETEGRICWQRSIHRCKREFDTSESDSLPLWLKDDASIMGEQDKPIYLRQFLDESCQPFAYGQQTRSKNVVYYFMVYNSDYDNVEDDRLKVLLWLRYN